MVDGLGFIFHTYFASVLKPFHASLKREAARTSSSKKQNLVTSPFK